MCPFRAGYKISATRGKLHAVFHMLRVSVPSACLGKNLRSKVFHFPALALGRISSSKLRDGTRDSVLALKIHAVLCTHRRCVGFSWAKPSVTKSSTHLLVFLVLKSTCSPSRWQSFFCVILCFLWFLKSTHAVLRVAALFEYFAYFVVSKITLAVLRRSRSPRPLNSSERSERNPKLWRSHPVVSNPHAVLYMLRRCALQ